MLLLSDLVGSFGLYYCIMYISKSFFESSLGHRSGALLSEKEQNISYYLNIYFVFETDPSTSKGLLLVTTYYTADMSLGEQMSMAVPKQLIYRRKHYLVTLSICTTSPFPPFALLNSINEDNHLLCAMILYMILFALKI